MSARFARKRSRPEDGEEDLPHANREPVQDGSGGGNLGAATVGASSSVIPQADWDAQDGQVLERDEEFWFKEGTIILVARNIEFRVYRGILAGSSSVFEDLFAQRHPLRNVPLYGVPSFPCPVVRVTDSPEDLRHLLRVCFFKWPGRLYDEREPSYYEISAGIRLGAKYKVAKLYSQSLEYLRRYFPSTFEEWIELQDYGPPGWHNSEEVGVVNLVRTIGEHTLLPSAFLACICDEHNSRAACRGIVQEDGSVEHLSLDDSLVCFQGKINLRLATISVVMRTFEPTASPKCTRPTACASALRDVLADLDGSLYSLLGCNPFAGYEDFIGWGGRDVCPSCTTMVHGRSLKERKDVWDQLPELLGIDVPGWNEEPSSPPS